MYYNWNPYGVTNWQQQGYESYNPNWYRQISIVDAINIALQQVPGEVVEAELERKQGKQIYEVDIITGDGTRYEAIVDRDTGDIINVGLD